MLKKCPGCGAAGGPHEFNCPVEFKPRHQAQSELAAEKRAAIARYEDRYKKRLSRVRGAIDAVLRTEAGRVLWAEIFRLCGYNQTSLTFQNTGEIAEFSTEAKEAQRYIYIQLRKLVSSDLRVQVEAMAENDEEPQQEKP